MGGREVRAEGREGEERGEMEGKEKGERGGKGRREVRV